MKVIIIMGSKSDLEWSQDIKSRLDEFNIQSSMRIASAHKAPQQVLEILGEYEDENVIYITVAGRSNALSGFVDANTTQPVIACPPYSNKFSGADIFSSLRMPSGVSPLVILEPKLAGLAAAKMIGLSDKSVRSKVAEFQKNNKNQIEQDDKEVVDNG